MNSLRLLSALGILAGVASISSANFIVTARSSDAAWDYLYGYGPDSGSDTDNYSNSTPLTSDSILLTDTASGSGEYLGHEWSVEVGWSTGHSYTIGGSLASATSISSQGGTSTDSWTGGATSTVGASTALTVDFTVTDPTDFLLTGDLSRVGPINRNNATLYVYGDFGIGYQAIFVSESNNPVNWSGTFSPANYRIIAFAASRADGEEISSANWNFNLQSVPEPVTMVALLPALVALSRRRRK